MKTVNHISVPIQMFIDAQTKGYQKELRLFLLLKLMYGEGKTRLSNEELKFVEYVEQIKSRKTTQKYISFLRNRKFLGYNNKTGYFLILSLDSIRERYSWDVRLAFPIDYSNYYKTDAVTGAVIYGYLHKDFWRKVKRAKSVQIKRSTYHFPSVDYNYKKQPAPVSVIGVQSIFDISKATASRLKNAARKEGFIKLIKNFSEEIKDVKMAKLALSENEQPQCVVYHNKAYRLRLIDTIYPLFWFKRRKNLET